MEYAGLWVRKDDEEGDAELVAEDVLVPQTK